MTERNAEILRLHRERVAPCEIERILKLSRGTVAGVIWRAANPYVRKGHAFVRGEANPRSRLRNEDVRAIRERRAAGETLASLGAEYRVDQSLISLIAARKRWSHVE